MLPVGWKQSKQPLLSSCILRLSPLLSHFFTIISCFHPFMLSPPVRAKHCLYGGLQQWRGSDSPRLWHTGSQTPSQVWKWQVQLSESESVSLLSDQSASWRAADRGGGVSFPECWCGRIKIGDVGKHNQERGVIVVLNHGYTFMNPPFIFLQCSSPHCWCSYYTQTKRLEFGRGSRGM